MLNRAQRRRAAKHQSATTKQTHKLIPQTCVVWVPACCGYVSFLSDDKFNSVDSPEFAYHLTEDDAEQLALALRQRLGLRASIRPYYAQFQG